MPDNCRYVAKDPIAGKTDFKDLGALHDALLSDEVSPKEIEERFRRQLSSDYEGQKEEYVRRFGNVINTDNARELSEDYTKNRGKTSSAVHEPASEFVKRVYTDLLKEPIKSGIVLFTAGGTGAGKTTAIESVPGVSDLSKKADVIVDGTMNGFESSVKKIDQALESGRRVDIVHVFRDPVDAFENGLIPRMKRMGRSVPIEEHVNTHKGSMENMERLERHYIDNDKVHFTYLDNSGGRGNVKEITLGELKKKSYVWNDVKDQLYKSAAAKAESGAITPDEFRGLTGEKGSASPTGDQGNRSDDDWESQQPQTQINATPEGQGQEPKGNQQAGVSEHPGTGTPREEGAQQKADNSDRGSDGAGPEGGQEKEVAQERPVTGVKNAVVNGERLSRELKAVVKEGRKSFGRTWNEAIRRVRAGYDPRTFVENAFKHGIKRVNDVDNATILLDRVNLLNEKEGLLDLLADAKTKENDFLTMQTWAQLDQVEEKLKQNDEVATQAGTVAGRALASRKMLAHMDYTLASLKADVGRYYKDGVIPPEMQEKLDAAIKERDEAQRKLADYEEKWRQQKAQEEFDVLKNPKTKTATTQNRNIKVKGKALADKIRKFRPPTDIAQANLFGLPIALYDTTLVTIANLVEGGTALAEAIRQAIEKVSFPSDKDRTDFIRHLADAEKYSFDDLKNDMLDNIRSEVEDGNTDTISKEMIGSLRKLAKGYIENGVENLDDMLGKMHEDLKGILPDVDVRDIRDAFSGYGDVRQDSEGSLRRKVSDLRRQADLTSQLEDAMQGEVPQRKGGRGKGQKSAKVAALEKQVSDAMKEQGLQWDQPPRTPRAQKEMSIESLKERIEKQIDNLLQIASKEDATLPQRKRMPTDDELTALRKMRAELLKIIPKHPVDQKLDEDQQVKEAEDNLKAQIQDYEERLRTGDTVEPEKKKGPTSRERELLEAQRDFLKEAYRKFKIDKDPQSKPQKIALEKYKDTLQNQIINYLGKIETGDFEERPRETFIKDPEAAALELGLKKAKGKFHYLKAEALKANRSRLQKVFDAVAKYRRFVVLTGLPTIGKITAAVAYRSIGTPVEEIVGASLSFIPGVRQIAEQAPREGGVVYRSPDSPFSPGQKPGEFTGFDPLRQAVRIQGQAMSEFLKASTWKDAKAVITGQGELEAKFGRYSEASPEFLEFMGRVHAAFKNFAKRSEFVRAYEKRSAYAMRQGFDTNNELVQTQLMTQAYMDANRSVFMQDNALTKWYSNQIAKMERPESENWQKLAAFMARLTMPIVKVPTNFAVETTQYLAGLPVGVGQVIYHAIRGDLMNLPPDQADALMRNLKKGSFGAGMFALGFYNPQWAGGYYVRGDKRDEDDVQWGQLEFMGVRIPRWATHAPFIEAMQFGATVRRLYDQKSELPPQDAMGSAMFGASGGLLDEVPLIDNPTEMVRDLHDLNFSKMGNKMVQSFIPIGLGQVAAWMDYGPGGNVLDARQSPIPRAVNNPAEAIEYDIPGLRSQLDEKQK